MRVLLSSLTLFVAAFALIVPLREVSSEIDKREIQENNGDELSHTNESNESNESSDERKADTGSEEMQLIPETGPDAEEEMQDTQHEPPPSPPPLPRELQLVFELQMILRAYDKAISNRAYLTGTEEIFDDGLDRYPIPQSLKATLPMYLTTSFMGMRQSGLTEDRVVAMQFSQLKTRKLEQQLKAITNFVQENQQETAVDQIPEQLIALAEDQTVLLAVKQRLGRFDPDQLASYLMEQNPFLGEERAADIVSKVEDKYAPLLESESKSSFMEKISSWWEGLFGT